MTFKKIVGGIVERDAEVWVNKLLEENGIIFHWTDAKVTEMKMDSRDKYSMYWTVQVSVRLQGYIKVDLFVGGTADEFGIYPSVIWDNKHNAIWFAVENTRETFGINEFKIA